MNDFINRLVDRVGDFLAARRGLLPLIGILFIAANLALQLLVGRGIWLVESNLLLHVGLIAAIFGILLIRPLQ